MDETSLTRDKHGGSTPVFEGRCTSEILQSAILVQVGDGGPSSRKDTSVIDAVEIMEAPENGQEGIRASPLKKVAGSTVQLKCI